MMLLALPWQKKPLKTFIDFETYYTWNLIGTHFAIFAKLC